MADKATDRAALSANWRLDARLKHIPLSPVNETYAVSWNASLGVVESAEAPAARIGARSRPMGIGVRIGSVVRVDKFGRPRSVAANAAQAQAS